MTMSKPTNPVEADIYRRFSDALHQSDIYGSGPVLGIIDELITLRVQPALRPTLTPKSGRADLPDLVSLQPLADAASAAIEQNESNRQADEQFAAGDVWQDAPAKPFVRYNPAPQEANGSFEVPVGSYELYPHERECGLESEDIKNWSATPGTSARYTYAGWQTYKRGPTPAKPTCLHDHLDERTTLEMRVASGVGFSVTCKGCDLQRIVYTIK